MRIIILTIPYSQSQFGLQQSRATHAYIYTSYPYIKHECFLRHLTLNERLCLVKPVTRITEPGERNPHNGSAALHGSRKGVCSPLHEMRMLASGGCRIIPSTVFLC